MSRHLSGDDPCGTLLMMTEPSQPITPADEAVAEPVMRSHRMLAPSEALEHQRRRQRQVLLVIRTLFLVLLVTVSLLPFVGTLTENQSFNFWDYIVAFLATFAFGAAVIFIDTAIPNKKLSAVFGIYLGI